MTKLNTEKLSVAIRQAVEDLEWCESQPQTYQIKMDFWHEPYPDGCAVCLAGSVIAHRIGIPPDLSRVPESFSPDVHRMLIAIDMVRQDDVSNALDVLGYDEVLLDWSEPRVVPYDRDPVAFKADMLEIADMLEERGI